MDDSSLFALLARRGPVPYPGTWLGVPFADLRFADRLGAEVARDEGLSSIVVDRVDGRVWLVPADGGVPLLVNSDVESLVACSVVYGRASDEVEEADEPEEEPDDEMAAGDAFAEALVVEFRGIDAVAVDGENAFWSVAAEELGYAYPG
ncbi:SUKH-4 family immunity protein [Umezawaea sp. NPDC059074]|uniref:SUKH-4 family immunity protein n=1 Tax=Umezawaea sp. NPDC059074 TaxID=3346716 RepID=UPI0036AA7ABC